MDVDTSLGSGCSPLYIQARPPPHPGLTRPGRRAQLVADSPKVLAPLLPLPPLPAPSTLWPMQHGPQPKKPRRRGSEKNI